MFQNRVGVTFWERVPKLSINFEEILSRGHEEQNKFLGVSIIINCRIIIINAYYKYIIIA